VTVNNPEFDVKRWAAYPNLKFIELLFRRVGEVEWHSALSPTGARIYIQTRVPEVRGFFC
jgi:hypothetical protein